MSADGNDWEECEYGCEHCIDGQLTGIVVVIKQVIQRLPNPVHGQVVCFHPVLCPQLIFLYKAFFKGKACIRFSEMALR